MINLKKIKNIINIPRSIYHYHRGNLVLPYLPNALWVEPTNVCNLKCIMCPNSLVAQKNPGFMDFRIYKRIIDEAQHFTSFVILCISGESLLHKRFPEMVKYAKEKGIATYLSTNATVLTPGLSRAILKAGLDWINFSFDGCSEKIYEKIRLGADFEKTLGNIIEFLKIKERLKVKTHVELQILIMDEKGQKDYEQNIGKFIKRFSGLPLDYVQTRRPSTWGKYFSGTNKFDPKKLGKDYSPCSYIWSSLHLLWDGRIVACTSDFFGDNVLGKFPEQSLKEIWNNEPMRKFRKAMIDKKYLRFNKNCKNCDSLWDSRILSLPPGIRGISATTLNIAFGKNFFNFLKKFAKRINSDFAIEVLTKE